MRGRLTLSLGWQGAVPLTDCVICSAVQVMEFRYVADSRDRVRGQEEAVDYIVTRSSECYAPFLLAPAEG